jgi:formylmethanofuran dehydrogenase subunit A
MELTIDQVKKIRKASASNWKAQIIEYLKAHNGSTDLTLYNATRPDRLDITETKKVHNIASQLTYLRDDGYVVVKEDKNIFLVAEPQGDKYMVIKGMEKKAQQLLG